ncbi:50S ribosomal protein L17 [Emticicia agri]|uniref:Large ribosomal subunit protein bL17 n=1 Tax=Emticicia agri TaxID=2492393 RepID=A0A4Q5LWN4_9BACT|nr:50S ribosomal protein L17 [Emticicia agri]RYU93957.1 50S ribosomal protein L17 [Emticicia agri]
MRHGNKTNHLGRTHSHRDALLKNLAISLIQYKRIETTLAKAKELRKYVEPLITKAKNDTTHSRRTVFSYLQDKESIKTLFGEIAEKVASRNGGYTRIIKLGSRFGDNAEVALIELVDYNEALLTAVEEKTTKTRRSRRGGKKSEGTAETTATPVAAVDESSAEVVEDETPVAVAEAEPATEKVADTTPAQDETPASEEDKKEA